MSGEVKKKETFFVLFFLILFITLLRPPLLFCKSKKGGSYSSIVSPRKPGRWLNPAVGRGHNTQGGPRTLGVWGQGLEAAGGQVRRDTTRPPDYWLDELIEKIWQVESSGRLNPPDGDSGEAAGPLQIHKCVIDDVNRRYGMDFSYADRRDLDKSKQIAKLYVTMWLEFHKQEIAARIFNGGPRGWQKKSTDAYWLKIQKQR